MNVQTIKTIDGQEFVLLPIKYYKQLETEILDVMADDFAAEDDDDEYVPFVLEKYIKNPIALMRIKAGFTQGQLAKAMGDSQAYVSQLESKEPTPAALFKVATALEAMKQNRDGFDPYEPGKDKSQGAA